MVEFRNNKESKFFYGWSIVLIAALGLFFSGPGQTYSMSIFSQAYIDGFGWSRSLVSGYYSLATLFAGLILPSIGRLLDKRGHRATMTGVTLLLAGACLWMSFVSSPWMLFIGFMMMRLFGQGSMTLLPTTLVPQWFLRHRGKALSIMALGGVLSSAILPPLNQYLINTTGIRGAWWFWTIALITIMTPIALLFVRNTPESMGLSPDGDKLMPLTLESAINHSASVSQEHAVTLEHALKTKDFWLLLFCMMVPSMINTGLTFHMVSIIMQKGHDATFAAFLLSLVALVGLPTTFIAGFLCDRYKMSVIKSINYLGLLAAIIMVLYLQSTIALVLYAIVHGVFQGIDSVSSGVLWPNYYGRKHLGSIRSVTMTAMVVGSALGPLPFGFAYDLFHGYREILLLMTIFPVLASIAVWIAKAPISKQE